MTRLFSRATCCVAGLVLALSLFGCFNPKGRTKTLSSPDGQFEITVPRDWSEDRSLNENAEIAASYRPNEMYVIVLNEPKEDFASGFSLEDYASLTTKSLLDSLTTTRMSSPVALDLHGNPALQHEIRGIFENRLRVVYLHTVAQSPTHFHQIVAWSTQSNFEKNQPTLQRVIQNFRAIQPK